MYIFCGTEMIPVGSSSNGIVISRDGYNGRTLIADDIIIMHINNTRVMEAEHDQHTYVYNRCSVREMKTTTIIEIRVFV